MKRILVVDDEPQVGAALRRLLRREGYEVMVVEGGVEALAKLPEARPDPILTDHRMYGMDGMQLLGEAERRNPGVRGVIVSGHADPDLIGGRYPFVAKPWDEPELLELIRRLLADTAR